MITRNIAILGACQAIGSAGFAVVILLGGIIGADLAPAPAWATLPVSTAVVGLALATVPAALLMARIGRRAGFVAGSTNAALAAVMAAYGVGQGRFGVLCAAMLLIGANAAFVQQYRFAAAESVEPAAAGQAVAYVLLGGVVAAYLGPELATRTRDWLPHGTYTGSFASLALLYALAASVLCFLRPIRPGPAAGDGVERPMSRIIVQPVFGLALLAGVIAYGVMTFIMTATPVHLHRVQGHGLEGTARVLQGHMLAMYLPSLLTGPLIARVGIVPVMLTGVLSLGACVALAVSGPGLGLVAAALALLGLGWNFLFVGGTVLLTRSYHPAERFKTQAVNDFTIFGIQAISSLSAGTVLFRAGWIRLNLMTVPLLLVVALLVWSFRRKIGGHPASG